MPHPNSAKLGLQIPNLRGEKEHISIVLRHHFTISYGDRKKTAK